MTSLQLLQALLLLLFSATSTGVVVLREGRHVCVEENTEMIPVTSRKSYCRAIYQLSHRPCADSKRADSRGLCPYFRVGYRLDMKEVVEMVPRKNRVFTCCPGWTGYSARHNACTTPICEGGCGRGDCRLPGKCSCPRGTKGPNCEEVGSSATCDSGRHGCQHRCEQTPGGVRCACHEGFTLAEDKRTCLLCLSCSQEFKALSERQSTIERKVNAIDDNFNRMQADVAAMSKNLKNLTSLVVAYRYDVSRTPAPPEDGEFLDGKDIADILESMDRDLAAVEARLGECGCDVSGLERVDKPKPPMTLTSSPRARTSSRRPLTSTRKTVTTGTTTTTEPPFRTLPFIPPA